MSFDYKRGLPPSVKVGDVFETYRGGFCTVIEYHRCDRVIVKFNDSFGYIANCTVNSLKRGNVKTPYYPIISGVGYIGVGKYLTNQFGKSTKEYDAWSGAMDRCYGLNRRTRNNSYIGCEVDSQWHNFQVFAECYCNHESYGKGYHLDKDLLVRGNKVYSAEDCCMLPKELNAAISLKPNKNSSLPIGVQELKGKYRSKIGSGSSGKTAHLGTFKTVEEASAVYVKAKEEYIHSLEEKWHGKIEEQAYQALMNWTVYP